MDRKRRQGVCTAAGVLLGALMLTGGAAPALAAGTSASAGARVMTATVPDDVDAWFDDEASRVIADAQQDAVTLDDGQAVIGYTTVEVGEPHGLRTWSDEFRAGASGAEATTAIPQWIAPVRDDGATVGTVSAYRDASGAVALAYFDDAASLASRLAGLEDAQQVVYDGPLDAYFLVDGTSIAPLSDNSRAELASTVPLDAFQEQLAARYAGQEGGERLPRTDPLSALAGGGASVPTRVSEQVGAGDGGVWLPVGIGLALVSAAGLALTARGSRRADV